MTTKEQQLDTMLKMEQKNELSSQQEQSRDITSKSQYRKPIKDPFSDQSGQSDSDLQRYQNQQSTGTPFPPKPVIATKTVLQQAQQSMKWDKTEQLQTQILTRLEGQGMKDKKIKQLASKYKALNIAYQKQKTQRKNLQNQLNSIMKTNDDLNKSSVSKRQKKQKSSQKDKQRSQTISNCLNCQQNQKKIMDFRLKNQNLKSQLNKVTRILTRELGEDFNIDQALNQQNGWKGRQQKIQKLKYRVKQLEDKLNNNGINVSHMTGFTNAPPPSTANFSTTRTSALVAENKRKQLDNLKVQVQALKSENQILQGKVKSLLSRKVILQNQMKQLKGDFEKKRQLLIQKSDNDDRFIQLLKNQNQKLKKEQKVVTKVIYKDDNAEVTNLKKQIQQLKKRLKLGQSSKNIPSTSPQAQPQTSQQKQVRPKQAKDLNSIGNPPRVLSAQKKKRLQQQYVKGNKYLSKMSAEDQEQLYKNWKSGLNKQG